VNHIPFSCTGNELILASGIVTIGEIARAAPLQVVAEGDAVVARDAPLRARAFTPAGRATERWASSRLQARNLIPVTLTPVTFRSTGTRSTLHARYRFLSVLFYRTAFISPDPLSEKRRINV
jgi:hypothetical protein